MPQSRLNASQPDYRASLHHRMLRIYYTFTAVTVTLQTLGGLALTLTDDARPFRIGDLFTWPAKSWMQLSTVVPPPIAGDKLLKVCDKFNEFSLRKDPCKRRCSLCNITRNGRAPNTQTGLHHRRMWRELTRQHARMQVRPILP